MPRNLATTFACLLAATAPGQQSSESRARAAGLLKAAYERVYSAEARGLALFKAGDIEMVVRHEDGETEWEDGLLWKAGFAPVIEHEMPHNVPLRPASEELLMSMLGWGMGPPPWARRFAGARFALVGRATDDAARIRVQYPEGERPDEVFAIEGGRIATVTNGTFRTSFDYEEVDAGLRITAVSRVAVASVDPAATTAISVQFTGYDDVDGVELANEAVFTVKRGEQTVRFTSELSKIRGNKSVPAEDVEAAYAAWAQRALRRAYDLVYSAEADGLEEVRIDDLAISIRVGEGASVIKSTAACEAGKWTFGGDPLPDVVGDHVQRNVRYLLGLPAWSRDLEAARFELQAAADPQRRMRIAIESPAFAVGAVATVDDGRFVSLATSQRSRHLRYESTEGGLRLVGVEDRRSGDVVCRTTFDGFRRVDGVWLPSRMRIVLPGRGAAAVRADLVLGRVAVRRK